MLFTSSNWALASSILPSSISKTPVRVCLSMRLARSMSSIARSSCSCLASGVSLSSRPAAIAAATAAPPGAFSRRRFSMAARMRALLEASTRLVLSEERAPSSRAISSMSKAVTASGSTRGRALRVACPLRAMHRLRPRRSPLLQATTRPASAAAGNTAACSPGRAMASRPQRPWPWPWPCWQARRELHGAKLRDAAKDTKAAEGPCRGPGCPGPGASAIENTVCLGAALFWEA
mmetsp:Transcript_26881/g.59039  ORF Transcript_26881/g.59039 Transcript_26881/m.59039 type:complete len:234 (+) Transcript_26881:355-1056(+)